MNIFITESARRTATQSLNLLIKKCDATKRSPSDVLYEDESLHEQVFKSLFQIKDLKDNFDSDTIIEFLDVARENRQSQPPDSTCHFLDSFVSLFKHAIDRWIAIVPIGFSSSSSDANEAGKPVKNQHFSIYSAQDDQSKLEKFLNRRMDSRVPIRRGILAHQIRQTNKAVIAHPLFLCDLEGSCEVVRHKTIYRHSIFMRLLRLYTTKFDAKASFKSMDHTDVRHFLLLDTKTGQLERFPLHTSGNIDAIWSPRTFKQYKKADFLFHYNFLVDSSSKLRNRLLRSLEFFSRGVSDRDTTTRFVSFVISLEALFSRSPDNPIKAYLAESAAIIEPDIDNRMPTYTTLRRCYDTRSKIVHSGDFFVPYQSAKELEQLAASVIFNAMNLIRGIASESGDEDEFFTHLLKSKLHLP